MSKEFSEVVALVINFNTSSLTIQCVDSLRETGIRNVLVLDNASHSEDVASLRAALGNHEPSAQLFESLQNLGFAAGSNFLIDQALKHPTTRFALLLNSDAVAIPSGMREMLRIALEDNLDLVGGKMLEAATRADRASSSVDSLGIAMYRPLLASNRKTMDEEFLGPTGGCAIYSRRLLEELKTLHGYAFDPTYFCYAEDTDLCIRARLLGATAGYADTAVAVHTGQASSGGGFSDFVLYHGIRNSIWTVAKSVPLNAIIRNLPWIILLHLGIVVRHSLRGKIKIIFRLYAHALRGMPEMLEKRKVVQTTRRISPDHFNRFITPKFYETGYLKNVLRELCFWRS